GALFLVTVWGAIVLARAIGAGSYSAYAAGICVGTTPLFAVSAYSGMEVMLCATLLVLGLTSLVQTNWGRAGLYLGLACTARPEAALPLCFAALFVLARLYGQRGLGVDRMARVLPPLLAFAAAPALLGASAIGYYLWASGRALPATYYVKQSMSLSELPERLWIAVGEMLVLVTPFTAGLAWVGLFGLLLPLVGRKSATAESSRSIAIPLLPLAAGALFILANVLLIKPTDPQAFYHQRYILPAVPLLVVSLVHGFERLGFGRNPWLRRLPLWGFVVFCLLLGLASLARTSRDHHSDTRNINELQRGLGLWLANHTSSDAWVASNDAGAVRYFSGRPVVDIMGLNTPELLWNAPDYARSHPVEAAVFMPAWFSATSAEGFRTLARVTTTPYTVTSYPRMATQVVLGCPGAGAAVPLRLVGAADVTLYCKPGAGGASEAAR
ncbi:MAG: hypothetical protein QF893_25145, partial [Alphaproteobacteria bacterium]|nr:hypothetical protein [Alphaproteobacteria bacterium]